MSAIMVPMPHDIVEVVELASAEAFLAELSPATGTRLWRRNRDHILSVDLDWIFRGQANGEDGTVWTLEPSAFRRNAFLPLTRSMVQLSPTQNAVEQRAAEHHHILKFASMVDRHGYIVPDDSHDLRDRRTKSPWQDSQFFPPPALMGMFALGQHYGIPTRLLDWTTKPHVAAYFAAQPVARRRAPGKSPPASEVPYFSVFAMNESVVSATGGMDPEIHIMTVPTATNPNLHAQGGVFSLVQPTNLDPHPLPRLDEVLRGQSDAIAKRIWPVGYTYDKHFPLLVEFRVPTQEARTVMMLLEKAGVTAATIFPGLAGVAEAMREERFYQWAPGDERS